MNNANHQPTNRTPLSALALAMTDNGRIVFKFLIEAMLGELEGFRPGDQISAAREILDRIGGRPATESVFQDAVDQLTESSGASAVLAAQIQAVLREYETQADDPAFDSNGAC